MVGDYSEEELTRRVTFPTIPPIHHDVHLGRMAFALARGQYRCIELVQYREPLESEIPAVKLSAVSIFYK